MAVISPFSRVLFCHTDTEPKAQCLWICFIRHHFEAFVLLARASIINCVLSAPEPKAKVKLHL